MCFAFSIGYPTIRHHHVSISKRVVSVLGPVTYCVLLKGYGRQRRLGGVEATMREMRASGVLPDVVALNAAVDAFVRYYTRHAVGVLGCAWLPFHTVPPAAAPPVVTPTAMFSSHLSWPVEFSRNFLSFSPGNSRLLIFVQRSYQLTSLMSARE